MQVIREYNVYPYDFALDMDKNAKILDVHTEDGETKMYTLEEEANFRQPRRFIVAQQGAYLSHNLKNMTFIATFKTKSNQPVCHLFDATPPPGPIEQLAAAHNA